MIVFVLVITGVFALDGIWRQRRSWPRRRLLLASLGPLLAFVIAAFLLPGGMVLQKVLGHLIMPAGLLWFGWLTLTLIAWHRGQRGTTAAMLGLWCLSSVLGSDYVGASWLRWLQKDYVDINPMEQAPFEAIFVLGGGTETTDVGLPQLTHFGDRVALGARMYHRGLTPILVASGRSIHGIGPRRDLARETRDIWMQLEVPQEAIITISEPRNTSEEVRAYSEMIGERGWSRVGLITSAWHLRRALRNCEDLGIEMHPLPAGQCSRPTWQGMMSVIPYGRGLYSVHLAAWETVGYLVGR